MKKSLKIIDYVILFALVFANIFLFSSVSPIHSILNLQYDEQVYNLIGKGMKQGLIPYIDLIDHKGIYLFMTYAIAHIICEWHHIGLFIVTLIINYVTAVFAFKCTKILADQSYFCTGQPDTRTGQPDTRTGRPVADKNSQYDILAIAVSFTIIFILNLAPLSTCGLDCETTIIPWISISFYLTLRYAFDDERKYYPFRFIFIDGILAAIVIFIKANAAIFFFAKAIYLLFDLFAPLLCISRPMTDEEPKGLPVQSRSISRTGRPVGDKEATDLPVRCYLGLLFVFGFLGLCIGLLPGIIYCVSTNSLDEMINHSFIVNFKYMGSLLPSANNHLDAFIRTIKKFWLFAIVAIASVPMLMHLLSSKKNIMSEVKPDEKIYSKRKSFIFFYIISLIFMLYIVFAPLRPYTHYLIFLLIYFIPVLIFIYSKVLLNVHFSKIIAIAIIVSLNILSYPFNLKVGLETGKHQGVIANEVKKMYEKVSINKNLNDSNVKEKVKLLVIGYSPYLYDALDTFPDTPYFATPVVHMKDYVRPYEELLHAIESGREDIIVTDFGAAMLKGNPTYKDIATVAILKNYKEVKRFSRNIAIYIRRI